MELLRSLLGAQPPTVDSLVAWSQATQAERDRFTPTIDRALLGGALADRLGYAFAGGYGEALRALVPGLDGITALCVTEDKGNSPRAIATTLTETAPDTFELTGHKKWATVGPLASSLLVAATTGVDERGRPRLRLVRVAAAAAGVRITPASVPFVPEIPHAEVTLDKVVVPAADVLPGDGYADYIKPFRTVEDVHVHGALIGYLVGVARRHGFARDLIERLLALATTVRAIAVSDRTAAATHVVLAGTLALSAPLVAELEQLWAAAPDDEWRRWQRDRMLLGVAGSARAARRDNAWSQLG